VANGADLEDALQVAEMEAERLRDEAALRGSRVHTAIAKALAGQDYAPEWRGWVQAAQAFLSHHNLKPVGAEVVLVSWRHSYGGTTDLICQAGDGSMVLIDWKSGRHPFLAESALQVGAYSLALTELTGRPVAHGYVVALWESGRYEVRQVNLPLAKKAFLGCLTLWRALRGELYE
jgi:ATP-dependent exoDNAse (exonuclease V) beta subunit